MEQANDSSDYEDVEIGTKNNGWVIGIFVAAIILIIIFIVLMIIFFLYLSAPETHQILVTNNSSDNFTIIISSQGMTINDPITPGQTITYKVTPGVDLNISTDNVAHTTARIILANNNFTGTPTISNNTTTLKLTPIITTNVTTDQYGISLTEGFDKVIDIQGANCNTTSWNGSMLPGSVNNPCPSELLMQDNCAHPCTVFQGSYCCNTGNICDTIGGCQATWDNQNYYNLFASTNVDVITNCDEITYTCDTAQSDVLTSYNVIFY